MIKISSPHIEFCSQVNFALHHHNVLYIPYLILLLETSYDFILLCFNIFQCLVNCNSCSFNIGAEHRHVGSNNFNLLSSRSHTIFTLVLQHLLLLTFLLYDCQKLSSGRHLVWKLTSENYIWKAVPFWLWSGKIGLVSNMKNCNVKE